MFTEDDFSYSLTWFGISEHDFFISSQFTLPNLKICFGLQNVYCGFISDISHMPITELENDSESVWVKVFTNKTSHFVASWYQPPGRNLAELTSEMNLLRSQLQKIKCMHKGNKPPSVHVMGDFNFGDIVWPDRLNKSGSPLSPSEGEILIEIMNDYGLGQLVHFPTRERNTLDLIITSLPGQFVDIHSPDRLSDHDIVSGTLKVVIPAH